MFDDREPDRTGGRFDWRTILRRSALAARGVTSGAVGTETAGDGDPGSDDEEGKGVDRRTLLQTIGVGVGITGLTSRAVRAAPEGCSSDPKIDVTAVDKTNYPEIEVQVQIKTEAAEKGNLSETDFTVREEGNKRSPLTCFKKLDEAGGGKVDIAFVIDDSHSMGDNISEIENNIKDFADDVESAGLDARYGLVTFCSQKDPDEPNEIDQPFTSDVNTFKSTVGGVSTDCGTREDNLDAINRAVTDMSWRSGAQKVIIHACDESQKGSNNVITDPAKLTTKLNNKDITLYSVADPDDGGIQSNSIPPKTGGKLLDIGSDPDFSTFLDDIKEEITRGQYKLCYGTPLLCDGTTRKVSVCVDDPNAGSIGATGTYDAPTSGEGCEIEVEIDIKPCSDPNAINPDGDGVIPVGIKHTGSFDPLARIDVDTLRFGDPEDVKGADASDVSDRGGASPAHGGHADDTIPCEGDGRDDLVVHFPTKDAGFEGDEERGRLEGLTNDDPPIPVVGDDSVKLVGGGGGSGGGPP